MLCFSDMSVNLDHEEIRFLPECAGVGDAQSVGVVGVFFKGVRRGRLVGHHFRLLGVEGDDGEFGLVAFDEVGSRLVAG